MPPSTALLIADPCLVSGHVAEAWLESGGRIAEIWSESPRLARPRLSQVLEARAGGTRTLAGIARRHDIPVRQVGRLPDMPDLMRTVEATGADTLLTVMSQLIVPDIMLDHFGRRAVNVHPSLLPKYGGRKPRLSMLFDGKGDLHGGVTFHRVTRGIDEGPIVGQRSLPWSETPHLHAWNLAAARAAGDITRRELQAYLGGEIEAVEQDPAERFYRTVGATEFHVTRDKPLATVRHLLACYPGSWTRWSHENADGTVSCHSVKSIAAVLGPPTGRAPRVGPFRIEADIADARLRLNRRPLHRATFGAPFIGLLACRIRGMVR
ncbi:formyltransferase family protein [Oricola sp.]|uniref:formyltransferase family protein n=1 Tax=Oricola sp. TaxID=1979950 RepID=UPI0026009EC2|nr:formyltransferase family protein [Oricola sp.]MCI5077047.1 hypothetical protein [Oricola sp.]